MTTKRDQAGMAPAVHAGVGFTVCFGVNYLVAYVIFSSSYGSVFFMSDDDRSSIVWIPLAVGAVVGCFQSLAFGIRTAAVASGLGVLCGVAFFMLGTLVLGAVGGVAGWVVAWALTRSRPRVMPG